MEKKSATELIEKTFNARFDIEQYTLFMRNLLNDYDEQKERDWAQGNYIYESFREHINRFKRLGIYTDPEGNEVELLVIETKATAKLERARASLRNFVIKRLNDKNRDYALAAFYSKEDKGADWRFSYIKIEHESYKDTKGKVKTKKELTPAKRFSFLVGEHEHAYTAQKQLLPVLQNDYSNPNIEDLESCFSIEKVTDEFFEQYKELYLKLSEHFSTDESVQKILVSSGIDSTRFTKKLLGQIVFLYFLQKKGWLGVPKNEPWGKGDKKFVQSLFEGANNQKQNFFKDYLQFLFYEALAKARTNSPDPAYYKRFDCKIPFLNGGLFEADYDWQNANLSIPNNLFRNEEKNKAGDKGTGVLDVFDRYNFTIKEDEPLEKEVAVDPEMLGKVFENMLEITERKSKGAFYTPREIVHYMCQESLINYLDNAVNDATESYQALDKDQLTMFSGTANKKGQAKLEIEHKGKTLVPLTDIGTFVRKGFLATENDQTIIEKGKETSSYKFQLPEAVRTHADELDKHLTIIKICDPAIGSGAFPVGLLHELVTAQKVLLPYLSEGYLKEKLKAIDLDKAEFKKDPTKYIYRVKRHAIQESIYGVDIDASAIDIARLRLWLSLIVDEEDFYSIEALPNLDYKIVQGNSLIGLPDNAMKDLNAEAELEKLKDDFFSETNDTEKKRLRTKINTKIRQLLDHAEQFSGYQIGFDFKLYFSEVWHYKKGFDIVIGNPPFVRQELFKDYKTYLQSHYTTIYDGRADLYTYFIKKGFDILCNKGILTLITSNKFIVRGYGGKIRKLLSNEKTIKTIVNFGELPVFKASVDSSIIVAQNKNPKTGDSLIYAQATEEAHITDINKFLSLNHVSKKLLSLDESWVFKDNTSMRVLDRLNSFEMKLSNLFEIFGGIKTGCDKAFIIDSSVRSNLIESDPNSEKLIKPWFRGRDIQKWSASPELFIIYIPQNEININNYPAIKRHLLNYKDELESRATNQKWFELQQPQKRFTNLFESEKIIYSEIALEMRALLDKGKAYGTMKMFFIPYNPIILAILNSSLFDWYARMNFSSLGDPWNGGRLEFKTIYMSKVPLPKIDEKLLNRFELIIKYITVLKENQIYLEYRFFEHVLDSCVFELYFPEQIEAAGKEILKQLGDIKPLKDEMSNEKVLSIILSEFNRLYDPNHPVRNNIETLDSVEEVRIIKEALK